MKNSKLIGICEKGISLVESIDVEKLNAINIEKINEKTDVDKDYVRTLLDDTEIIYLLYSSEEKRAVEIVKAIGFMASERKVLCIGIDADSAKEDKIEEIDRNINIESKDIKNMIAMFDMISESISDEVMINIDITDLRDIFITEKGMKYSYTDGISDISESISAIKDNMKNVGDEFLGRKCIAIIEGEDSMDLSKISQLMEELEKDCSDRGSAIFATIEKNDIEETKITVLYN